MDLTDPSQRLEPNPLPTTATPGAINRVGIEAPWNIGEFYGQSYFCDPRGRVIAEASRDKTELITAEVDLDMIREVRNVWQFFRDRRPETYGRLTEL